MQQCLSRVHVKRPSINSPMKILRKVENLEADSFKVVKIGEGSRFFQGGKTPVSNTRETLSMANQSKPLEFLVGDTIS